MWEKEIWCRVYKNQIHMYVVNITIIIKTHDSELRGQEQAVCDE